MTFQESELEFVVAARNAESTIEGCVRSLLAVAEARRVWVVNDDSRDGTAAVLAGIDDSRLRVLAVRHRSRARASNVGFRATEARFVCSVDADIRFVQPRFAEILPLLDRFDLLMLTDDPTDVRPRVISLGERFAPPRNSFIFSRHRLPGLRFAEIYPRAGGEDTELAIRLLKSGVSIGAVYGGYVHDRVSGSMGWRRRVHFHVWNTFTYCRHLDVPMCRQRLTAIMRHPLRRVVRSVREERSGRRG